MKQNFENTNKRGIDLRDLGIDAYAYDYSVIPDLLDNLKANNQIILGGDVFCYKNGQLTHTYDNWYYEKQDPTIDSSKSIFQTEKYISNYVKNHGEHYYFSIVLDNEEFNLWLISLENILQSTMNQASNTRNHVIIEDSDLFLEKGYLFNFLI